MMVPKAEAICKEKIWQNKVLVIDTEHLYMYDSGDRLDVLKNLDEIRREEDILKLREQIKNSLN